MFNQNNEKVVNSLFDLVDNDFMVNYLMDPPHTFPRTNSNQNFIGLQQNFSLLDNQYDQLDMKQEEPIVDAKKQKQKKRKTQKNNQSEQIKQKDPFQYKNNLKNTYINKITNLVQQDSQKLLQQQQAKFRTSEEDRHDKNNSVSYQDIEDSTQAKLLRNRECARNSRKRKKIYIELLENRVKQLNDELEKQKLLNKTSAGYLNKMSQNQQLQGFFLGRQQLYEKLEKSIQNKADDNELNLLLDSMRFRVGGGGKERVSASNYFFNQILEICFPVHVRYMLWAASENKDLFADQQDQQQQDGQPQWLLDLTNDLQISEAQKKQMKKSQRRIISDKNKLLEILTQFQEIKEQLYNKTSQVENFIDELRNILNPTQVGKFLIGLEKNKFRREMTISKIWNIFDDHSEDDEVDVEVKEEDSVEEQTRKKVQI
ncbi:unnamed protein product [Paramecium primaurelia]|uniref:BZIP domain-containing protein n=1 Tax=Paramecium primaurelia TaxID=5886 RepID=A0A8S1NKD5_PARPR|nr:unnamed protein product [Paramecium primaurelia]